MAEGGQRADPVDDAVVPASDLHRLEERVRELERLVRRKTLEVEILKEALDLSRAINRTRCRALRRCAASGKTVTGMVGIFPNEDSFIPLVGAILLEPNDERAVRRARYMILETIAPLSDDLIAAPPAVAA
jgi:hypothetical protein